jgi:hypothetical protein
MLVLSYTGTNKYNLTENAVHVLPIDRERIYSSTIDKRFVSTLHDKHNNFVIKLPTSYIIKCTVGLRYCCVVQELIHNKTGKVPYKRPYVFL